MITDKKLIHEEEHLTSSALVRDIVIGMSDGLTVPFALAAGLSGAVDSNHIIITAGIAEIAAGSIAMGLGGFLAGKTEVEHYQNELRREFFEVDNMPEKEKSEVKEVFEGYGLSSESQELLVNELAKDKVKWVNFMMRFELGLEAPDKNRARASAITIASSYAVGGIIPLSGYFIAGSPFEGLIYSSVITLLCLLVFGYYKSKIMGQNSWKGALNVALIGALASTAAYLIAKSIS